MEWQYGTSQGRYPVDESFSDAGVVATQSTTDGSSIDTLRYTSGLIDKRIRVPQIAFIDFSLPTMMILMMPFSLLEIRP